jgi:hypothetical protein
MLCKRVCKEERDENHRRCALTLERGTRNLFLQPARFRAATAHKLRGRQRFAPYIRVDLCEMT